MTLLEQYEAVAHDLTRLRDSHENLAWDHFGDVLEDNRLPLRARSYLRSARERRPHLKAGFGPFRQMVDGSVVADADQAAVVGTTEAGLFPAAQYTGFAANQLRAGQVWELSCFGVITTPGSGQGNITVTPRFGTTSGGTSLGASTAAALVASGTNVRWDLTMKFIVRAVGLAGANSHVVAGGKLLFDPAACTTPILFGSTAVVSVDLSTSAGLYIGITLGSASDSMKCLSHPILESLN